LLLDAIAALPRRALVLHKNVAAFAVVVFLAAAVILPTAIVAQEPYPYPFAVGDTDIRLFVTPKGAEVYVDGVHAGIVDDFSGFFQRLHVLSGVHEITLHLDGYRTVTQKLRLRPHSTYKIQYTMEKLPPGEASEPPPAPQLPAPPPPPMYSPGGQPQSPLEQASSFGTLAIRVQPAGAEILIDGDRWTGPEGEERLIIQLSEGAHHLDIRKDRYRQFSTDVRIRRGETTPLNVSLPPE
jgi:hypothetical protein